jgi:hypothetical protein
MIRWNDMDSRYREGAARLAMEAAQNAVIADCDEDRKSARYCRRLVMDHARFLMDGLEKIAARDGMVRYD